MKYVFVIVGLLFFVGCSPKYKIVSEHILPVSETAKSCIKECQKSYSSCKEICKANFEICKDKAKVIAKKNYEKKMKVYHIKLEQYADDMDMYELERDLLYFDGYFGYGYGYYPGFYGFYRPNYLYMHSLHSFRPKAPKKPSLQAEIEYAQMSTCQIDCGCSKTYDSCFTSCGGEIKHKKICIKNCPDDK